MITLSTPSHLAALVLMTLCTTIPALGQPNRKAAPVQKTAAKQSTPAAQRPKVASTVMAAPTSAPVPKTTPRQAVSG